MKKIFKKVVARGKIFFHQLYLRIAETAERERKEVEEERRRNPSLFKIDLKYSPDSIFRRIQLRKIERR